MELIFLGTGAGRPLPGRNVTSIALRLLSARGTFWLFDCGEGTQHQLMRTPLKLSRLERIFVTHLHGDHTFGLAGLISSRAFVGGSSPLSVYGPVGLRELIETNIELTQTRLEYELHIHEIERDGVLFEDDYCTVSVLPLDHRIACYGYRLEEKPGPGKLNTDKLAALGGAPGPMCADLKRGDEAVLPDGRIIRPEDVIGPSVPGRIVTILGDTSPCANAVALARGADVLVHEATFDAALGDKALEYGHSTTKQAAETAAEAGARRLVMTHFSSRYRDTDLQRLTDEARAVFASAEAAADLLAIAIPGRRHDPA